MVTMLMIVVIQWYWGCDDACNSHRYRQHHLTFRAFIPIHSPTYLCRPTP